jgi:HlyD family secretion protein
LKKTIAIFAFLFVLLFCSWFFFIRGGMQGKPDVIYRTQPAMRGDATLSITATGVLQPLTTVDVKSKAGGEVVKLAVDEGTEVEPGQLIAEIDPRDTKAAYDQVQADLNANIARAQQSRLNESIESVSRKAAVENSEAALKSAKLRLQTLEARANAQPTLTAAAIKQAQANYDIAVRNRDQLIAITIPQTRATVQGEYNRSQADLDAVKANYDRKKMLLDKGYVAAADVETARTQYEAAQAAFRNAKEKLDRLEDDLRIQRESAEFRVQQAKAALDTANANTIDIGVSRRDLEDAKQAVIQAQAALDTARANLNQVAIQREDYQAAQAAIVRSKVARDNAKVQLQSTTVVAPRKGVVTIKYIEEGTIIPPGTSTFSQGTSIVQIADTTRMYVEVQVDEADIGSVKLGQPVLVTLEAAPRSPIPGTVSRINPSAVTTSGVTTVKVRVEIKGNNRVKLMPGLNASCEFIINQRKNVLVVPNPAIQHDGDKTYVEILTKDQKPVRKYVKIGAVGNSNTEILEGIEEGANVITAKIDRRLIEEQTQRMQDASTQRSPFSGGNTGRGGSGGGAGGARGR